MTTCQHDPLFTHDGRCSKCYPPKRVVMVQHADGTQEVHLGLFVAQAVTNERARVLADEKRAQFIDWQHGERGAGCAGNDSEICEAGGFG